MSVWVPEAPPRPGHNCRPRDFFRLKPLGRKLGPQGGGRAQLKNYTLYWQSGAMLPVAAGTQALSGRHPADAPAFQNASQERGTTTEEVRPPPHKETQPLT